jgi:hypothetical protein
MFKVIGIGKQPIEGKIPEKIRPHIRYLVLYRWAFSIAKPAVTLGDLQLLGIRCEVLGLVRYWNGISDLAYANSSNLTHLSLNLNCPGISVAMDFTAAMLQLATTVTSICLDFKTSYCVNKMVLSVIRREFRRLRSLQFLCLDDRNMPGALRGKWICYSTLERVTFSYCRVSSTVISEFMGMAHEAKNLTLYRCVPGDTTNESPYLELRLGRSYYCLEEPSWYDHRPNFGSIAIAWK